MPTVFPDAYIDDSAYDEALWNGDGYTAPSRNAVRDLVESIKALYALKTYVDNAIATAVTGLLDDKGPFDCSANPNYPVGLKGDAYHVTVAGKIGGASGVSVDVGDVVACSADNAGGTQAAVGTSWYVLEHNLAGALLAANNLSDVANALTALTNLGGEAPTGSGAIVRHTSPTIDGTLTIAAGTAALAGLHWPLGGTAPTSPANGNLWSEVNSYKVRIGGVTYSIATTNLSLQWSGKQTFPAATTGSAGARIITSASEPTSPLAGDLWTSATALYCYLNSTKHTVSFIAAAETLSNKTIASPTLTGKTTLAATVKTPQSYSPAISGTATLDCNAGDVHRIAMPAGNITIALSNVTDGQTLTIAITQDGTGSRTVTWFSTIRWAGGSAPTLTTTASKRDIIVIHCMGTGTYDGMVAGANI